MDSSRKRPASVQPITSYFCKRSKADGSEECSTSATVTVTNSESSSTESAAREMSTETDTSGTVTTATSTSACSTHLPFTSLSECDIGQLIDANVDLCKLEREHKYRILTTEPTSDSLSYPRTRPCSSSARRQFQPSWLHQYPWLHYSRFVNGAFCRACAMFAPEKVSGQAPGQFVRKPFSSWIKMSIKAKAHMQLDYHQTCLAKMEEFMARYKNPTAAINVTFDSENRKIMKKNQKVIESLLKVVMLCGKQGLAFRGHRDDCIDFQEVRDECSNQGNFIELVRFRAETDRILADHLASAPRNAVYTSKTIQNNLIDVISTRILTEIVAEVKKAKYYTIIADEVTDLANKEQLSLVLRYILDGNVNEVFVDFVFVERITGAVLARSILQWLSKWDLPYSDMRGQCYDGASNMAGARSGCMAIIQQQAPKAAYFHCAAHRLNLAVVSACKIQEFKNTESYIGEIARFFRYSAKRQRLLDTSINKVIPETNTKKLKDACRTRWVERIDSYTVFLELLPAVSITLQAMVSPNQFQELGTDWTWDGETVTKANGYLYQLQSSSFLICFKILLEVMCCIRGITKKLQLQALDVLYAYKEVNSVVSILKGMRENSDAEFHKIFQEATKLGEELHGIDFELGLPRIARRQVHRSNPEVSNPEDFYRITLYDEFLSHVVAELNTRFLDNPARGIGLLHLLPSECCKQEVDDEIPPELAQAVDFYRSDLPHSVVFPVEYRMWRRKWKHTVSTEAPNKLVDVLQVCSNTSFPNICVLLQLALTLPITSCESERSFSQLKLIKTSHRSTMSSERLSGLAMLKINRERCQRLQNSPEKITELVKLFAQANPRRMKLPFVLGD